MDNFEELYLPEQDVRYGGDVEVMSLFKVCDWDEENSKRDG
jgi:hypothetical protein